jgi:acyl-CoA thioesterase-2
MAAGEPAVYPARMDEDTQKSVDRLIKQLELDQLDRDLFLGDPGEGERRLFGGLVAAQSVVAAYRTVDEGALHSLHAYFLRPGKHDVPIRYVVYRIRDGRSFTTRDVVAYQSGEAIFNLSSSFVRLEDGVEHQEAMPDVPGPDNLPDWEFLRPDAIPADQAAMFARFTRDSPVEMRACDPPDPPAPGTTPRRRVWTRVRGTFPDDPMLHAALLTYASDRGLIATARFGHGLPRRMESSASLDHALWFHRPARFDDWLLFTSDSPVAHGARAMIFGEMWSRDGTRVASVAQEGLIRIPRDAPSK